jgi:hypothetical protein
MTISYFEEIEKHIMSRLNSSQSSIFVAVAWFTNQLLFDSIMDALKKNVAVKILILDDILNRNEFGLDFGVLSKLGAEVRFWKSDLGTMHNKFCIIDDLVITGSYNWTYHANKNSENILMTDEESIVNGYKEEFDKLFGDAKAIPQPYEHLKWTDVKEGDFSELRRNIFRDVIAKNDENRELKRIKLINLDHAYKSGDAGELAKASSLATGQQLRTITDVLTSRSQDFAYRLWEENIVGKPFDDVDGHAYIGKWWYVPYGIKEDKYHREYIEGTLKTNASRNEIIAKGLNLNIYDEQFVSDIKKILCSNSLSMTTRKSIPDSMLRIDLAKMFYYQFPNPMFNKSQPGTWKNTMPRTISAINLLGIVKEVNGDDVVFYEGWDPQNRGEKIAKEFFTTSSIEQADRTITDVITNTQKRYVGELYYEMSWDSDEEPADVRFSSIDKWIFIPDHFGESKKHEKYVRGYLHFYKWYKRRDRLYEKIEIDIYDGSFISCIEPYLQGSKDTSKIPEDLLCINLAKLSVIRLPESLKVKGNNAIAVFCLVKEVSDNNIIYFEGWDPQQRGHEIIKKLRQG